MAHISPEPTSPESMTENGHDFLSKSTSHRDMRRKYCMF